MLFYETKLYVPCSTRLRLNESGLHLIFLGLTKFESAWTKILVRVTVMDLYECDVQDWNGGLESEPGILMTAVLLGLYFNPLARPWLK